MLKKSVIAVCFLLSLTSFLAAQSFPESAVVLEKAKVSAAREMVLWMENPTRHPRETGADEAYTCPEETRGHYYTGVAKVSLVDPKTKKIVDTVELAGGTLDLPYLIKRGYYDVPTLDRNKEGKPVLMKLKDYNGDGRALEFAIFDAVACMGLPSTLIGYSPRQDRVIQYRTELKTSAGTRTEFWVDYFFGRRADSGGLWKYEIDYRGRAGTLDKYELRYDRRREMFYGTLTSVADEEKAPDK